MSLTVLFGTHGFTIGKMLCLESGKTKYSFSEPGDCCNDKGDAQVIKNKCCDLKSSTYKLSAYNSFNNEISLDAIPAEAHTLVPAQPLVFSEIGFTQPAKAPPLSGREIKILTSILII